MWSIPGLNTRETAVVVLLLALLVFVLTKPDVRQSVGSLVKLFLKSAWLAGLLVFAAGYAMGVVILLRGSGYSWNAEMTKTAVVWFLGIGVVYAFDTRDADARYWKRLILHNLTLVAIVEFVVNLHTFPLPVELVLVPMAFLFTATQVVAESSPEYAPARKLIGGCIGALGIASLSFSVTYLAQNFTEVATAEKVEEFLLPLVLTACFVPFLYLARFVAVYQTMLHMIRFGLRDDLPLYRFARRSVVRACGVSLRRAQLFEKRFRGRLWGATTEGEVLRIMGEFRQAWEARHSSEESQRAA